MRDLDKCIEIHRNERLAKSRRESQRLHAKLQIDPNAVARSVDQYVELATMAQQNKEAELRRFLADNPSSQYATNVQRWVAMLECQREEGARAVTERAATEQRAGRDALARVEKLSSFWARCCTSRAKGEFETTPQYEARLPKIDATRPYYFEIDRDMAQSSFDADAGRLTIVSPTDLWPIGVEEHDAGGRKYIGQNAFGVRVHVREYETIIYRLFDRGENDYGPYRDAAGNPKLEKGSLVVAASVGDARCFKERGRVIIGVRFPEKPRYFTRYDSQEPTIDNSVVTNETFRDIDARVFFVGAFCDGKMLAMRQLPSSSGTPAPVARCGTDQPFVFAPVPRPLDTDLGIASNPQQTEVRSPEFQAYYEHVLRTIRRGWVTQAADANIGTTVGFSILPDGRLASIRTVKSSGDARFDISVLNAVRAAQGQLGPPPDQYRSEFSDLQIMFRPGDLLE